jgi:preprotein translocase subunit YajC
MENKLFIESWALLIFVFLIMVVLVFLIIIWILARTERNANERILKEIKEKLKKF